MQKGCAFEMISSEVQAERRSLSRIHLATSSNSFSPPVKTDTKISKQMDVKYIYPFIAILYIMGKFVEMDEKIKFKDQTEEKIDDPIEF